MNEASKIQKLVNVTVDGIIGPKTIKAIANILGCANSIKGIQKCVGVTADGIIGPKTLAAILDKLNETEKPDDKEVSVSSSKYEVILDPGHTSDYGREHPSQFTDTDWSTGKPKEIADILGFTKSTNDSLEHLLNLAISKATEKHLKAKKINVLLVDYPSLSNNAEITAVYKKVQEVKPKVFLSIHNNAVGSTGWKSLNCKATGTVGCYKAGRDNCKKFAQKIASDLIKYRKENEGPHNRADSTSSLSVGVLNNSPASVDACLVEVGFYDNLNDLYWMATHIDGIGECLAETIVNHLK